MLKKKTGGIRLKKYAYLLDSTLCVSREETEQTPDFFFIPLYAVIDGELYKDMIDIQANEFYEAVRAGKDVSTTQASAGEFLEKYEEIRALGYTDVFVFTISSTLSGVRQTAITAGEMIDGLDVHVPDAKLVTGVGTKVIEEVVAFANGTEKTPEEIDAFVCELGNRVEFFLSINTLDSLKKGGRISATSAAIGSLLNIKPIVTIKHGIIEAAGKERTVKKGMKHIMDMAGERKFKSAVLLHSSNPKIAEMLEAEYLEKYPDIPYEVIEISPVIGVHTGPEVGAISIIYEDEK